MSDIKIETPRGAIFTTKTASGTVTTQLVFYDSAFKDLESNLTSAQVWLDNAVLKDSDQFVPMQTGALKQSGILGTVIGSGKVKYIAPYARKQYYASFAPSKASNPQASREWFEVAKAINKDRWTQGVKSIISRGGAI